MSLAMNSSRFEPQGSYFDQYPDRRTRFNSYAAPILTHSATATPSSSSSAAIISSPRRATLSSRGLVKVIAAADLSSTPIVHRSSTPPAPPADLGLLQRARRGSANGASSFVPSAAPEMSLSSSMPLKVSVASQSETSSTRTVASKPEAPRRRLSSPPHTTRAVDLASEKPKIPPSPTNESMNKSVRQDEKFLSGKSSPTTTSASSLHQSTQINGVPSPPASSELDKVRRSETVHLDDMTSTPQPPLAFLVHPDRPQPKSAGQAGVKYLLPVSTTPRGTTTTSTAQETGINLQRGDDQHRMTSLTSASSRRYSFISPGSRISKLFSSRSTSSLNSTPSGITSSPSVSDFDHRDKHQRKSSPSSPPFSTRGLGTTGVRSGSPQTPVFDLFAGPGVYDPLQGLYRPPPSSSSTPGSPLHPQGSQHPGLPVPADEFGGRGVSTTRGVSAPPDLDALIASMNGRVIGGSRGGACSSSKKKSRSLVQSGKSSSPVEARKRVGDDQLLPRSETEPPRESIPDIPTPPELEVKSTSFDKHLRPHQVVDSIPDGPIFGGVVRPSPVLRAPSTRSSGERSSRTPSPRLERYSFIAPVDKTTPVDAAEMEADETKVSRSVISPNSDGGQPIDNDVVSTSMNTSQHSIPDADTKSTVAELGPTPSSTGPILSIDEIVRQHAGASYLSKLATSVNKFKEGIKSDVASTATSPENIQLRPSLDGELLKQGLSECFGLRDQLEACGTNEVFLDMTKLSTRSVSDDTRSILSAKSSHSQRLSPFTPARSRLRKLSTPNISTSESLRIERDIALVLRSSQLTRLITLQRPPNLGLTVSYADVGASQGHPVLIHLGLGCVRYIVALYDEMAKAYNLRIICVDRWGLGRSSDIPDSKRGFGAWALVMEEIVDRLGLQAYSIVAHSAGGPYAVAAALSPSSSSKVKGSLHLLAPWIISPSTSSSGSSADALSGAYKLLKYVPTGVLRTAQLAEWKVTARKLGKPPTIQHAAVGYDAKEGRLRWTGGGEDTETMMLEDEEGQIKDGRGEGSDSTDHDSISQTSSKVRSRTTSTFSLKTRSIGESFRTISSPSSPSPPRYDESISSEFSTRVEGLGLNGSDRRTSFHPPSSPTTTTTSSSTTSFIPPTLTGPSLIQGLLRASHAESLRGSTSDLALLLNRCSNKNPTTDGLTSGLPVQGAVLESRYGDLTIKIKIWHGERDERISLASVKGLQQLLGRDRCEVRVVEGADHGLITNATVIGEVFESIAEEWKET